MAKSDFSEQFNATGQLAKEWTSMHGEKGSLLDRSRQYAGWTLPALFPQEQVSSNSEEFQFDFQSIGARSVNHLANKLVLALFAPSRPFFRLDPSEKYALELEDKGINEAGQKAAFAKAERNAMSRMNQRGIRVAMPLALKLLMMTGNALTYFPVDGTSKAQIYNLYDYCVRRDLSGNPVDMMTQEKKQVRTLTPEMQNAVKARHPELTEQSDVTIYTRVVWHEQKWHVYQALNDVPYGDRRGMYSRNEVPWIPLTWTLPRGKNYGVGLVEEYSGDFHALSTLSEAMVIGASIAADIKFLVDPTGVTDPNDLNKSHTGAYVPGRAGDITTPDMGSKQNDWSMVLKIIDTYEKRIGMAFLLGSAVTRDAERVTAEEIRFQAMELETSLGGVYSRLAEDLQTPMAYIFLNESDFNIGDGKQVKPVIITGLEALSRNSESEALVLFLNDLALITQLPDEVKGRLELNPIIATLGAARGVEYEKYLKDETKYQEEQKELLQLQQEMVQQQRVQQPRMQ